MVVVEWASRIAEALPADRIEVTISHVEEQVRRLVLNGPSAIEAAWRGPGMTCPICQRPVGPDAKTLPFCSPRCRLVDLGRWMEGRYRIER